MSTPSKKKPPTVKVVEPKPKFSIGQKVFIIDRGRSYPGYILQAKIESVKITKALRGQMSAEPRSQVKLAQHTSFEYDLSTPGGYFTGMAECILYHNLTAASLDFTDQYTTLLK